MDGCASLSEDLFSSLPKLRIRRPLIYPFSDSRIEIWYVAWAGATRPPKEIYGIEDNGTGDEAAETDPSES